MKIGRGYVCTLRKPATVPMVKSLSDGKSPPLSILIEHMQRRIYIKWRPWQEFKLRPL
jgi:hypothetical protein